MNPSPFGLLKSEQVLTSLDEFTWKRTPQDEELMYAYSVKRSVKWVGQFLVRIGALLAFVMLMNYFTSHHSFLGVPAHPPRRPRAPLWVQFAFIFCSPFLVFPLLWFSRLRSRNTPSTFTLKGTVLTKVEMGSKRVVDRGKYKFTKVTRLDVPNVPRLNIRMIPIRSAKSPKWMVDDRKMAMSVDLPEDPAAREALIDWIGLGDEDSFLAG